jgi:predicted phosphate transport protein (TIGR00153 family)
MFLANLFSKNPFTPLKDHMAKSLECIDLIPALFDALRIADQNEITSIAKRISSLEHQADVLKHEIRSRLTSSIFLPVDRRDVLSVLHHMDAIADQAEDLGVLCTLRPMHLKSNLEKEMLNLVHSALEVVRSSAEVIDKLDILVEAGFSGPDVDTVLSLVDHVGSLEHEADKAQDVLGKTIFRHEDDFKAAELFMWIKIANKTGDLANAAERMVNQVRVMVARSS